MKYLLLLAFWCIPATAAAQAFVVRADKMNKVYIGIENPMTIVAGSCGCDALLVSVDKGKIEKTGDCKYKYTATEQGNAILTVAQKKGGKTEVLGTSYLRVKHFPDPQLVVGGKRGGGYALDQFKAQMGVNISIPFFEADLTFKVTAFTFKAIRNNIVIADIQNQGNLFSKECRDLMAHLKSGDKVVLENIKCNGPDNVTRKAGDLSFLLLP